MIFNRSYKLNSNKQSSSLKQVLLGKHTTIHGLDFEVVRKDDGGIRIVPHAEEHEEVMTLPITRLEITDNKSGGAIVKIYSHPRLIDIGGPYILVTACVFLIIASVVLNYFGGPDYATAAKIGITIPLAVLIIFWIRMEMGYFDYIRKIKQWIKKEI